MAWYEKKSNVVPNIQPGFPKSNLKVAQMVKSIVDSKQTIYHDTEPMEVIKVIKNGSSNHGAVIGTFINNPNQEILGEVVLPLTPHITAIPLIGEQVVVIEYNNQHYYTSIIARKNNVNENSIPGLSGDYQTDATYGKTFERKRIKNIYVNEGEIVFEGRFGNTIKFGCNYKNNSPNIRIRAGQNPEADTSSVVKENINKDGSSIYLSTDETINLPAMKIKGTSRNFSQQRISGKSIVMNSDKLFLNARDGNINLRSSENVTIQGAEVFIHAGKRGTIKLGDPASFFIPTLRTDVITDLFKDLIASIQEGFTAIGKATNPPGLLSAAKDIAKIVGDRVPNIVDIVQNEKYLNKEIMIALPGFNIADKGSGVGGGGDTTPKTLIDSSNEEDGYNRDGTFDSDNFERQSNRDASGKRDTGPRRY